MSAASFGVSDFFGGLASRRVAALRVVLISTPGAVLPLGILAVILGGHISGGAVVWGALGGLSQALGVWWFFAALSAGPITVVSPLSALVGNVVPIGVGLALGERPGAIAAAGIGLALVAVVLVTRETTDEDVKPHRFTVKVAWLTVGCGVALGLSLVFLDQTPAESGLWPLLFARAAASVLVIIVAAASGNLRLPSGTPLRLGLLVALLDTIANATMLLALHGSLLSLVSVLVSLYPAATVVLAIVVLRERVHRWQLIGMLLVLLAAAMITTG